MTAPRIEQLADDVTQHCGDCLDAMRGMKDNSLDSCVTDPPYGLGREPSADETLAMLKAWIEGGHYDMRSKSGFMGREWDAFVPQPAVWREVYRVIKPGAFVIAFFGTRTYDIGVMAMRLAGFEIRDMTAWMYGSGFPKSLDVGKAIDRAAGAERDVIGAGRWAGRESGSDLGRMNDDGWEGGAKRVETAPATAAAREWQGWGTALKPAFEPIVLARKPLSEGTVAANVLRWRTGALNIDGCRIETAENLNGGGYGGSQRHDGTENWRMRNGGAGDYRQPSGRWPANVVHDGSDEVVGAFPESASGSGYRPDDATAEGFSTVAGGPKKLFGFRGHVDAGRGSASRFFYSAKASKADRAGSKHPTVKPVALMQWLCRLVTPPGGVILDPFAGSGTTGAAALAEGFKVVLCELEAEYQDDIRRRIAEVTARAERDESEALKQPDMFIERPAPAKQERLL